MHREKREILYDEMKWKTVTTHSVEHCGADGFNYEVVIQTLFLKALVEVTWNWKLEKDNWLISRYWAYSLS